MEVEPIQPGEAPVEVRPETPKQPLDLSRIRHTYQAVDYEPIWPGRLDDHVWPAWRLDLHEFAPLIF